MLTITRRFEFEAAHYLPNHLGKCRQIHGHSYKMDVTIAGSICNDEKSPRMGMLIDFAELNDIVKPVIAHCEEDPNKSIDHGLLNNIFSHPTAEVMVEWFANAIQKSIDEKFPMGDVWVHRVDLWENSHSYASWTKNA